MLLSQVVFDAFSMIEDFGTLFPETATRFLAINGQRRPMIDMRPGEVQRWRLVGAEYQDNMLLELDKHRLNVIAYDGIQLGTLQELKQLLIAPGQRADVLVQAGGPGTYELNAMPFDQGHASPTGPLARVVVAGEPLPMALPAALPKPPLETIRDSEITGRRTLVLGATSPENDVAGHWQEFIFTVDGKIFDPARIDQRVRLGAVEEWTIRNSHEHDDHMFHIHTNPFQVVEVSGQPQIQGLGARRSARRSFCRWPRTPKDSSTNSIKKINTFQSFRHSLGLLRKPSSSGEKQWRYEM